MNYLIIKSHPYDGSFSGGVSKAIEEMLIQNNQTVVVIDLIDDKFDPVMHSEDLRLWREGKTKCEKVISYQDKIAKADILVFPFPIWWGAMPAILKGFCEKVLLPGWAYKYGEQGELIGQLTGKKAVVITTMETSIDVFNNYFGDPVEGAFIKDTLQVCGFEVSKRFEIDHIVSGGKEHAEKKMNEIVDYFKG